MWKRIERLCEEREPVTPSLRTMFDDPRAAPAVLTFLRDTKVGMMISLRPREEEGEEVESEEGGLGPP